MRIVRACPAMATQRIGTNVRRLIGPKPLVGSRAAMRLVSLTRYPRLVSRRRLLWPFHRPGCPASTGRTLGGESYRGDARARRQSRQSCKALYDSCRGGRDQLSRGARYDDGAARRQRCRQDDDALDLARSSVADLREGRGPWRRHAAPPVSRAAAHEFHLPLCRPAASSDGAPEPPHLRPALRLARAPPAGRRNRARPADLPLSRAPGGQTVSWTENARRSGEGVAERPRTAAARRADGLARPGYRRLGARLSRGVARAHKRHDSDGLP